MTCPDYFRWIHQDLLPWKQTGITRDMVDRAQRTAHFRLVIIDGKAYVEKFRKSIQTRDMFTLWGILQLLRWYPGRLPDLELMFDCDDRPVVRMRDFRGPNAAPPPLFRYCGDDWSLDIVFPDWSFWGGKAETNIKPWRNVLKDIKEGNRRTKWKGRVPLAYWRGNPHVAPTRGDLLKCNVSDKADWNTRLYLQDWDQQSKIGYRQSNLEDQCTHRYKIYIEGWAWSVSEKYILACDSMTLFIRPRYHDFFIRGLVPLQHYWPIRDNKCRDLRFAVEWGNNHTDKAQTMGETTSKFIQEDLKMDYVYDYMFHLLNEYAKLLKFKPTIPPGAVEVCAETMACPVEGAWRKFMEESLEKIPTDTTPCSLPPPYDPPGFHDFIERKANATRQVELWENEYWDMQNKKQ
ncbi:protein O-glucosyltransferase 1-like [Vitis riparia]|uniref:protein O-glucosyltransferase 1-like n=1 Tax=Vitis riparia TaxID=96939 RepID=UPI00155A2F01|nr:protein O-glucosyltransferase 1-like [Vitis riparia]